MIFQLGQKVKYDKIVKKIKIGEQYLHPDNFTEGEEKYLKRREIISLDKVRTGYIAGRRRFVFGTTLGVEYKEDFDFFEEGYSTQPDEWVDIISQEWGYVYLVAYDMGKTNYVLEKDLKADKNQVNKKIGDKIILEMPKEKLEQLRKAFKKIVFTYFVPLGFYNKSKRYPFTEDDMVDELLMEVKIRIKEDK